MLFTTSSVNCLYWTNIFFFKIVLFGKRKNNNHKTIHILKMKAHFEKQPHFENEGSFRNTFWKWKHVFGTLFYCWNLNNIKYCKNQNQTTSKSECSYQLSNLIYLFNYFKRPGLFLTYLLTNTHSYLSNVIHIWKFSYFT